MRASQELVYRFNLEPIGYGNTLPERRRDREDVKWTLRSAQTRRSIFQVQEGEGLNSPGGSEAEAKAAEDRCRWKPPPKLLPNQLQIPDLKPRAFWKPISPTMALSSSYVGLNFAVATPVTEDVELIFAVKRVLATLLSAWKQQRRFRVGDRHRVGLTASGLRFESPVWTRGKRSGQPPRAGFIASSR